MNKFNGSLKKLKNAVAGCKLVGTWSSPLENGLRCFRAKTGEILNWWPKTGTVQFQGESREKFQKRLSGVLRKPESQAVAKIFVTQGHAHKTHHRLKSILVCLGLNPVRDSGGGKTIVETSERHTYKKAGFGIVLLTPNDFGCPDGQGAAGQNVFVEMGMMMVALGRDRMVILTKGALELPSAVSGISRIKFDKNVKETTSRLAKRLRQAGFEIDPAKIAAALA